MAIGVLVIDTGGTFTMKENDQGELVVAPADEVRAKLKTISTKYVLLGDTEKPPKLPELWWHYHPLKNRIDSSDATPLDWKTIADTIYSRRKLYDGFVIIHGTDTLAYSSAALSFLLLFVDKPIIVTGAQVPIFNDRNDATNNLLGSLDFAFWRDAENKACRLAGVLTFFCNKLMAGTTVVKVDCERMDAFDSPRAPLVGEEKGGFPVVYKNHKFFFDPSCQPVQDWVILDVPTDRGALFVHLFPGIRFKDLPLSLYGAIVIAAFGMGNGPASQKDDVIAYLNQGGLVAVVTECLAGRATDHYASGLEHWDERIVLCPNMSFPAANAKANVFLGNQQTIPQDMRQDFFKKYMQTSWRGEVMHGDLDAYMASIKPVGVHPFAASS